MENKMRDFCLLVWSVS